MARDRGSEQRPAEEQQAARRPLVTPSELRPRVEHPNQRLKHQALEGVFPPEMIQFAEAFATKTPAGETRLRRIIPADSDHTDPTIYEATLRNPEGRDETLEIDLVGPTWKETVEVYDQGSIVRAGFVGKFRRKGKNKTDNDPPEATDDPKGMTTEQIELFEEGQPERNVVAPGSVIGWRVIGKVYSEFTLPKDQFPNGGRIKKFTTDSEMNTEEPDIVCYVERL